MRQHQKDEIAAILKEGVDCTVATVRPDGAPQATVVSYASDGQDVYFGAWSKSQKAANLAKDPRVAITVTLPYRDWSQIRGLSLFGTARPVTDPAALEQAGLLFMQKFPEMAQFVSAPTEDLVMFKVTPQVVSILDYRQGFGHTELVEAARDIEPAA
jgi:PPOX class probable F420-dependent enzyme